MDSKPSVLRRPKSIAESREMTTGVQSRISTEPVALPEIDAYDGWANQQADYLRTGRFELLDLPNVIDEIEALGRSEINTFRSNLTVAPAPMLKWDYLPSRRTRSWANSIGGHRDRVELDLSDNPSLPHKTDEIVVVAYKLARRKARRETRLPLETFPETCPYTWARIVEMPYEANEI